MTFIEDYTEEDTFDDFEEKNPLEQWKDYKKEGGFYERTMDRE